MSSSSSCRSSLQGGCRSRDWPLAAQRRPGHQLPGFHTATGVQPALLAGSVVLHDRGTPSSSRSCSWGMGLGLALLVQEGSRWVAGLRQTIFLIPVVVGLATASLLFLGPLLATDRAHQPIPPESMASTDSPCRSSSTPIAALLSTVPHRLEVRRPLHAHPPRGAPGHPRRIFEAAAADGANRGRCSGVSRCPSPTVARPGADPLRHGVALAFDQFTSSPRAGRTTAR